jgi:hypothetical protein
MKVGRSVRWGLMAVLGSAFPFAIEHSFRAAGCPSAMTEQPMPVASQWKRWPLLPGLGGYEVVDLDPPRDGGLTSWRPHATNDARLTGHGVCPERGASLQAWFGQFFVATSGDDWTIRFREDPETEVVVVTAERRVRDIEAIEPRPLVAFRVERDGTASLFARVLGPPLFVLALLTIAIMRWGGPTQSAASSRRHTRSSTSTRA